MVVATTATLEEIKKSEQDTMKEIREKLGALEKKASQIKVLEARHHNIPPETQTKTILSERNHKQLSPEMRLHIGKEMLLYEEPMERLEQKHDVSKSTLKRIKRNN